MAFESASDVLILGDVNSNHIVIDGDNNVIQLIDSNGNVIIELDGANQAIEIYNTSGELVGRWNATDFRVISPNTNGAVEIDPTTTNAGILFTPKTGNIFQAGYITVREFSDDTLMEFSPPELLAFSGTTALLSLENDFTLGAGIITLGPRIGFRPLGSLALRDMGYGEFERQSVVIGAAATNVNSAVINYAGGAFPPGTIPVIVTDIENGAAASLDWRSRAINIGNSSYQLNLRGPAPGGAGFTATVNCIIMAPTR